MLLSHSYFVDILYFTDFHCKLRGAWQIPFCILKETEWKEGFCEYIWVNTPADLNEVFCPFPYPMYVFVITGTLDWRLSFPVVYTWTPRAQRIKYIKEHCRNELSLKEIVDSFNFCGHDCQRNCLHIVPTSQDCEQTLVKTNDTSYRF